MDNSLNSQIKTSIKSVKGVNAGGKNVFAKEAQGNFWDFLDGSLQEKNFSWSDNIQAQIDQINSETAKIRDFLGDSNGNNLNLMC